MHNISLIPSIWDSAHKESAIAEVRLGRVVECEASRNIFIKDNNLELSTSDFMNSVIIAVLLSLRFG